MIERHAAQAPALRERIPQTFNIHFSIFNLTPAQPVQAHRSVTVF
jgi:hypothetical protein